MMGFNPRTIRAEVLEEFDAALHMGHELAAKAGGDDPDSIDGYLEHCWRNVEAKDRMRDARKARRADRKHVEWRVCPRCGGRFFVVVSARPGRVREYCADACYNAAKCQRHRELTGA